MNPHSHNHDQCLANNDSLPGGSLDRRGFLRGLAAATVVGAVAQGARAAPSPAETAIKALHDALTEQQKKAMCFEWDRKGPGGLPLRLHVSNNWAVSNTTVGSLTREQQGLVEEILKSVLNPGWPAKLAQQAKDDTGKHWTQDRKIALFGKPGGQCQCVISGFHLTFRAGSASDSSSAFGGAIAHGHQPSGFNEKPGHPGNIFWYQAQEAHKVYQLLDGKQRQRALVLKGMPYYEFAGKIDRQLILPDSKLDRPLEPDIRFRGPKAELPGLRVADMSRDQKEAMRRVLAGLLDPYQPPYRAQVMKCLEKQGGLEACHLIVYREHTLGKDGEWDNWRLEGPAFVWYFRGYPHVHIWFHAANDPSIPVTSHFG
jgi:Protein of unknown function (DUF3500)